MSPPAKPFVPLLPPTSTRPRAAFFGRAGTQVLLRDQLSLPTWLCIGGAIQGLLFLVIGRIAFLPACAWLVYEVFTAYAMSTGLIKNRYMDDVLLRKFSAQFPDEYGQSNGKPASSDLVVLLIGMRVNHPYGVLAPGLKDFGGLFNAMSEDLEKHADEFGYLGMTSWISNGARETKNELLNVGYFRTMEGLQAFAHSKYHMDGWRWWNRNTKQNPHLSIYHEVYDAPAGHWENIYVNSHPSHFAPTTFKYTDETTGEEKWMSPVVDAGRGVLRTGLSRMARSDGSEHEKSGIEKDY